MDCTAKLIREEGQKGPAFQLKWILCKTGRSGATIRIKLEGEESDGTRARGSDRGRGAKELTLVKEALIRGNAAHFTRFISKKHRLVLQGGVEQDSLTLGKAAEEKPEGLESAPKLTQSDSSEGKGIVRQRQC